MVGFRKDDKGATWFFASVSRGCWRALMTCALERGHYAAIVVEVTQEKKQKEDKEEKDEVAVMVVVREDGV